MQAVHRDVAGARRRQGRGWQLGWLWGLLVLMLGLAPAQAQLGPVPSLVPTQLALETGATGTLNIVLSAPATTAQTFIVSNGQPSVVEAPTRVVIPVGGTGAALALRGLASGTANLRVANNTRVLAATVQVIAGDAVLTAIQPPQPGVALGGDATLQVEISAVARAATTIALLAEPASGLTVPAQVVMPAGASSAAFTVRGQAAGLHSLRASLRGQTLAVPVRVTTAEAAVTAVVPDRGDAEVGTTIGFSVRLSRAVSSATEVLISTDAPNVIDTPPTLTVPAGAERATVNIKLKEAGRASLRAKLGETGAQAEIEARAAAGSNVPPALTIRPGVLGIVVGGSGQVTVEVDAARGYDMPFTLSILQQLPVSGSAAVVGLPASVTVPAGQRQASFAVTGLSAGTARLGIKFSNNPVLPAVDVTVGADSPGVIGLSPGPQPIAKGTVGTAVVTISPSAGSASNVGLSSDTPTVVSVPQGVVVPAGGTTANVPMSAMAEGTAQIAATLNGRTASAQVLVGPAVPEELRAPASLAVNVGASARIAAELLMTDGKLVADPLGITWTSSNLAVATVSASGEVTGVAAGSASIEGVLNAQPTPLRVRVTANVTQLPMLSLLPATAQVALGGVQAYTVSSPVAAPVGGLEVRLSTGGVGTAQLPPTVTIPAGATSVGFDARGTGAGALQIRAEATGRQSASATLTVVVDTPTLSITSASPLSGSVGTVLTIIGTGFDSVAGNNTVRIGSVAIEITQASPTQLVTRVPISAVTGPISVSNTLGTATGPTFTVQQSQDALLVATPNNLRLLRSSEAASALTITSVGSQTYTGSFNLSISGLPAGVTASFEPVVLPAGRTGVLRLQANGSVAPGTYQATVTGNGYGTAGAITRAANLNITVPDPQVTPSTGVRGRFVTPEGRPIAGVVVRADTGGDSSPTVQTDAAGSFELAGLAAGPMTLRFDATPANPLYPIWPYSVTVVANQMILLKDFVIAPPPEAQTFTPISNATQDQKITDTRFPGLEIVLPAGAEIVGWDGVKKTQIAVEKRDISELPVVAPPVPTGTAYQLYFGTPMGGVPSKPIPISLPNDTGAEPGESVNVWFFDGSPIGGSGEWKIAGQAVVSADGKVAKMLSGGLTRFCGVCGLACLQAPPKGPDPGVGDSPSLPPPKPEKAPEPPAPVCPVPSSMAGSTAVAGNPVNLYSGQQLAKAGGLSCGGYVPFNISRSYNPVDAFNNIGGTEASIGYGWTNDYDTVFLPGPTKRLILPGNVQRVFTEAGGGNWTNLNDPSLIGAVARDVSGNWQISLKGGAIWKFQPFAGAPGNVKGQPQFLVEIQEPNGRKTTISRSSRGQLLSVGTAERRITAAYGPSTFIETLTDPEGRTERYTYTSSKRLETATDPDGRVTRYAYVRDQDLPQDAVCASAFGPDLGERIRSITYPGLSTPTENYYGSSRRILRQTTATGREYRFSYKVGGACVTNVASAGVQCSGPACPVDDSWENFQAGWRFHGGQVLSSSVFQPDGTVETARFGSQGQLLESTSSSGQRAVIQRDAANRPTRVTDGTGRVGRSVYDADGNLTRHIDALGRITEYGYDPIWGKPTAVTRYDDAGTPQTWQATYDSKGNLASSTDPLNNRMTFGYSAQGQLTSVTDALNQTSRFSYNAAGDLSKLTDPLLNDTLLAADASGRPTSSTDALGYTTRTQTNGIGQTTQVEDAIGGRTRMTYDGAARLTSVTNPRDYAVARYSYDVYGRLTTRTDAADKSDTYSYDSAGRLETVVDRKGQTTRYVYDAGGRVVQLVFPDRTRSITYDGANRVIRVEEGSSRIDLEYDSVDHLMKEVQTNGGVSHEVSYAYDRLGRRVGRLVDGSDEVRYEWDSADRLTAIHFAGETTRYAWDATGRLTRKTLASGMTADYGYDGASRLLQITYKSPTGTQIEKIEYTYDARGMRTSKSLSSGGVIPDSAMTANYDAADRMNAVQTSGSPQPCTLTYDDNGNMTRRDCGAAGVTSYRWDSLDRLVGLSGASLEATFSYDVIGRRSERTVNGVTTQFLYDGIQAIGEKAGPQTKKLLTGPIVDEVLGAYGSDGSSRYVMADALNSVVAEVAADGTNRTTRQFSAFGESSVSGEVPSMGNAYTGREDDKTSLIFYRARYYDPALKRFVSEDPMRLLAGANFFAYVNGRPTQLVDALGLEEKPVGQKAVDSNFFTFISKFFDLVKEDIKHVPTASVAKGVSAIGTAQDVGVIGAGLTNIFSYEVCQQKRIDYLNNPCPETERAAEVACTQSSKTSESFNKNFQP